MISWGDTEGLHPFLVKVRNWNPIHKLLCQCDAHQPVQRKHQKSSQKEWLRRLKISPESNWEHCLRISKRYFIILQRFLSNHSSLCIQICPVFLPCTWDGLWTSNKHLRLHAIYCVYCFWGTKFGTSELIALSWSSTFPINYFTCAQPK